MFVDEVTITVKGGKGGNGALSFRREKYVPYGGPDGGNGGNGGDVVFLAENNCDTLSEFRAKKVFLASDGIRGGSQNITGKCASPLILKVPVGTVVYDTKTKEQLCDLSETGQQYVVVSGGRGGYGNAHFTSSTRQAPKFAELGDEGEQKVITLVLKLIADVGIIGFPNAGKSTLISHVSNVKPKIANYPFTTLIPHLGIVQHKGKNFVISDNPGLIEGAARGKGLGIEFLKHIERTRVLLHLIDGSQESPYKTYKLLSKELKRYDTKKKKSLGVVENLLSKPQIYVVNKVDLLTEETIEKIRKSFRKDHIPQVFFISAATGKGVGALLDHMIQILNTIPKTLSRETIGTVKIFRPHLEDPRYFEVLKKRNIFIIQGQRIEQIVRMTPVGNQEALERIYDVIQKMGIYRELVRQGAKDGQKIQIGKMTILFRE